MVQLYMTNVVCLHTLQDMYVFISEKEYFSEFSNKSSLFWLEEELQYGDWLAGPSGDGSFSKSGQVELSEVSFGFLCFNC